MEVSLNVFYTYICAYFLNKVTSEGMQFITTCLTTTFFFKQEHIKTSIAAAETLTKYPKWWHIPLCKHIPRGESRSKLHFHYVSKMCYIWVCNRNRKCTVKSSILENDELSNFTQIIHIINFDFGSFRIITHIVIRFSRNWQYQSLNMI